MRTEDLLRNPSKWLITVLAFLDFLAKGSVSASIALSKYHKIQKFFVQAANTIEKLSSKLKAAEAGRKEAEDARDEAEAGRKEAEDARDDEVVGRKEAEAARDEAVTGRKEAEAARDEAVAGSKEADAEIIALKEKLASLEPHQSDEEPSPEDGVSPLKTESPTELAEIDRLQKEISNLKSKIETL